MEAEKNGLRLQELGFKVSCAVNGEDASPTFWAGVLGKAVWQLFWGQKLEDFQISAVSPDESQLG